MEEASVEPYTFYPTKRYDVLGKQLLKTNQKPNIPVHLILSKKILLWHLTLLDIIGLIIIL